MITWFKFIVFLHIVSAVVWLGAALVLEILNRLPMRAEGTGEMVAALRRSEWFGSHVFGPASIGTILTGILGVIIGRPDFSDYWVIVALIGVLAGAIVGAVFVGRSMGKLAKLAENPNVSKDELVAGLAKIKPYSFLSLSILFYVLFDMVMRPQTPDRTFTLITAVYFLLVVIWIVLKGKLKQRKEIQHV